MASRPETGAATTVFTEDEALGLGLGLSGVAPAVEGALAKVERVIPEVLGERIRAHRRVPG